MRLTHPLWHHFRRLLRLPDHHVFYENTQGFVEPGCGLCEKFLAELLADEGERTTTPKGYMRAYRERR